MLPRLQEDHSSGKSAKFIGHFLFWSFYLWLVIRLYLWIGTTVLHFDSTEGKIICGLAAAALLFLSRFEILALLRSRTARVDS